MKHKDIQKMTKEERMKKMEELKFDLVKAKAGAAKTGSSNSRVIKKVIARILTLNNQDKTKGVGNR